MTKRDSGILELFGSLGDLDVATRVKATTQLIKALQAKQEGQQTPSEDLNYALKRLVRGLSSYRDGARQGFALGLTEVHLRLSLLISHPVKGHPAAPPLISFQFVAICEGWRLNLHFADPDP
jgi:hypothetical protein